MMMADMNARMDKLIAEMREDRKAYDARTTEMIAEMCKACGRGRPE